MKIRFFSDADEWTSAGSRITDESTLAVIREVLEKEGPVLIQHWFYRGSCAPEWHVFDEFENFSGYLTEFAFAGDAIDVWSVYRIGKPDDRVAEGRCPDDEGRIPKRGAY